MKDSDQDNDNGPIGPWLIVGIALGVIIFFLNGLQNRQVQISSGPPMDSCQYLLETVASNCVDAKTPTGKTDKCEYWQGELENCRKAEKESGSPQK